MKHQPRPVEWLFAPLVLLVLLPAPGIGRAQWSSQEASQRAEKEKLLATTRDPALRESDPDRVIQAIERLGMMNDTTAIDDLIPLLTFRRLYPEDKDPSLARDVFDSRSSARRFPAIEALALIGRPALPPLIRVIGASDPDSLEGKCALEAVRRIFLHVTEPGAQNPAESVQRPWNEAAHYLLRSASQTSSPATAERLQLGAEKLKHRENYKPPY